MALYVTCPMCKTRYDMTSAIPDQSKATVVCVVCKTQLEVEPRGALYLNIPKVTVRNSPKDESNGSLG
jgi:transcription elongation factor Elf1